MMARVRGLLFFVFLSTQWAMAGEPCADSHQNALKQCRSHEHGIQANQLLAVSTETRSRVAEKETDKLFAMGRACAKAQKLCEEACSKSLTQGANNGVDITKSIELQSDCAEGVVAQHRSSLAKKYLEMKSVLDAARTPANR